MQDRNSAQIMVDAFKDELHKLATCRSHTKVRKGKRPIRVEKLLAKKAAAQNAELLRLLKTYKKGIAPAVGSAALTVGGWEAMKGEGRKYQTGRKVHKMQKQQMRQARRG
jgi:hypothetical protein